MEQIVSCSIPYGLRYLNKNVDQLAKMHKDDPSDEYVTLAYLRKLIITSGKSGGQSITEKEKKELLDLSKSKNPAIRFEVATLLKKNGFSYDSIPIFSSLYDTTLGYKALYAVGDVYFGKRNFAKAKYYFDRAIKACPDDAGPSKLSHAKCLIEEGDFKNAKEELCELRDETFKTKKTNKAVFLELGKIFAREKDYNMAYQHFMFIIFGEKVGEKDYLYALSELGQLFNEMGDVEASRSCFAALIECSKGKNGNAKDVGIAIVQMAKLLFRDGNDHQAIELLTDLLSSPVSAGFARKELAAHFVSVSNFYKAEKYYNELIHSNNGKDRYCGYTGLIQIYIKRKEFNRARDCYALPKDRTNMNDDDILFGTAVIDYEEGKYEAGIEKLNMLINKPSKKCGNAFYYLGKIYIELRDLEKAKFYLKKSISILGNAYEPVLDLVHIDILEKKYDAAIETLNSLIEKYPKHSDTFRRELGVLYVKMGDYISAEKELIASVSCGRYKNLLSSFNLGRLYSLLGRFDEAKEIFNSLKDTSFGAIALVELGNIEVKHKNLEGAIKYYDKAINNFPEYSSSAIIEKAKIYIMNKKYRDAEMILLSTINSVLEPDGLLELGRLYIILGRLEEAKEKLEEIISKKFRNAYLAKVELGKIAVLLGNEKKAEEIFGIHSSENRKNAAIYLNELGKLYFAQGRLEESRNCFDILKDGNFDDCIQYLIFNARIAACEGNYFAAEVFYSEAINKFGLLGVHCCLERGRLYATQGKNDEAIADFKKLKESINNKDNLFKEASFELSKLGTDDDKHKFINSMQSQTYVSWDSMYYCGLLSITLKEYDCALDYFKQLEERKLPVLKNKKLLTHAYGLLYTQMGDYKKAKEYFNQLTECDLSTRTEAYLELGKIALLESDYIEATRCFKILLETKYKNVALDYLIQINSKLGNETQYCSFDTEICGNFVSTEPVELIDVSCDKKLVLM